LVAASAPALGLVSEVASAQASVEASHMVLVLEMQAWAQASVVVSLQASHRVPV
jgi:hypothetical protein